MALSHGELLKLKRWNTPTIANAIEQLSRADPLTLSNLEEARDFMPDMGPMVGYAMTVVISGGDPRAKQSQPQNFNAYREYLASRPGPKIVVIQDADHPRCYGAFWGEIGANHARALGCVGTITDGAIRDLAEMKNAGFKALARRLAVSHAHTWPLRWGVDVDVFGTRIKSGQLIHADQHGFTIIPTDAQPRLLEAARFMDDNECDSLLPASRGAAGRSFKEILRLMQRGDAQFGARAKKKFGRGTEWSTKK
jgi:4-hydroxy-4-methyl-2-oxoglutarate aldolase